MGREIREGRATGHQLDEALREQMRRDAAEREGVPDSTEHYPEGGFGSGQGMGTERTGQEPDRPDEQGKPRGEVEAWPT